MIHIYYDTYILYDIYIYMYIYYSHLFIFYVFYIYLRYVCIYTYTYTLCIWYTYGTRKEHLWTPAPSLGLGDQLAVVV
jgi:hypothetical protein